MKTWFLKRILNENYILNNIIGFFIFQSLFITLRILLIGSNGSTNIYEFFISSLPELFALYILLIVLINKSRILNYHYMPLECRISLSFFILLQDSQ